MPVELGYVSLPVGDIARARAFYGALFGWDFEEGHSGGAHVRNTKFPLGLKGGEPGEAAFVYFRVPDLAFATRRVTELGGRIRKEAEFPSGLSALCEDDQGTVFSLWQPAAGY